MSNYAEMSRGEASKGARAFYLELRSLGLDLCAEGDAHGYADYRIVVGGLSTLTPAHADRVVRLVRANEVSLARVLLDRYDPNLHAIRTEGCLG